MICNVIHIYLRLVRLLKTFSSITDMLLFCNCLLIINKCLYQTNGLLLYFNDTYLIILNGVTTADSLNYLWYVCLFDKYLWIIGLLIFLSLFWIIVELRYSLSCFEYYARSNILNTDSSRLWESKFSSMMWSFWCDCWPFLISKEQLAMAVYILFSLLPFT